MRAELDRRRTLVQERLGAIPGVHCARLVGAFYTFPDIRSFGLSGDELADRLLADAGVAVRVQTVLGPAPPRRWG